MLIPKSLPEGERAQTYRREPHAHLPTPPSGCQGPPSCELRTPGLPLGKDDSRSPSSMPTPSVPPAQAGVSLEGPGAGATAEVGQLSPRERGGLQRKSSGGGVMQEAPYLLDSGPAPPCFRRRPPRRRPPGTPRSPRCSPAQALCWGSAQPGMRPRPGESRASSRGPTAQSHAETWQPRPTRDRHGGRRVTRRRPTSTCILTGPLPRIPSHPDPESHHH